MAQSFAKTLERKVIWISGLWGRVWSGSTDGLGCQIFAKASITLVAGNEEFAVHETKLFD